MGATKIVQRELGIQLAANRFSFVVASSYLWEWRQQEPQRTGQPWRCLFNFFNILNQTETTNRSAAWTEVCASPPSLPPHPRLHGLQCEEEAYQTLQMNKAEFRLVDGSSPLSKDLHIVHVTEPAIIVRAKTRSEQ